MFIEHRFSQLVVGTSKPIEVSLFFSNILSTGGAVFKTGDQVNQYLDYDWRSVLTHVDKINLLSTSTSGGAVFNKTCDQTNKYLDYNWCNILTHLHDIHFSFAR